MPSSVIADNTKAKLQHSNVNILDSYMHSPTYEEINKFLKLSEFNKKIQTLEKTSKSNEDIIKKFLHLSAMILLIGHLSALALFKTNAAPLSIFIQSSLAVISLAFCAAAFCYAIPSIKKQKLLKSQHEYLLQIEQIEKISIDINFSRHNNLFFEATCNDNKSKNDNPSIVLKEKPFAHRLKRLSYNSKATIFYICSFVSLPVIMTIASLHISEKHGLITPQKRNILLIGIIAPSFLVIMILAVAEICALKKINNYYKERNQKDFLEKFLEIRLPDINTPDNIFYTNINDSEHDADESTSHCIIDQPSYGDVNCQTPQIITSNQQPQHHIV